jgi:chaperonin GroES
MSKIRPLGNRILIKRAKPKTTKGGIILPESSQEKPKEGEVIAVGPGKIGTDGQKEAVQLKIGDKILFSSYAGTEVKNTTEEDGDYLILTEDDVLGVLN